MEEEEEDQEEMRKKKGERRRRGRDERKKGNGSREEEPHRMKVVGWYYVLVWGKALWGSLGRLSGSGGFRDINPMSLLLPLMHTWLHGADFVPLIPRQHPKPHSHLTELSRM